jgi:hypothetical protein
VAQIAFPYDMAMLACRVILLSSVLPPARPEHPIDVAVAAKGSAQAVAHPTFAV